MIDDCVTAFTELLLNSCQMMSHRIMYDPNKISTRNVWFDKECLSQKRFVIKCLRNYQSSLSFEDKNIYVQQRKVYKQMIKHKKQSYNESKTSYLVNNINNSKYFWKELRSVCKKHQRRCNIEINQWYNYFCNLFSNLCKHSIHLL